MWTDVFLISNDQHSSRICNHASVTRNSAVLSLFFCSQLFLENLRIRTSGCKSRDPKDFFCNSYSTTHSYSNLNALATNNLCKTLRAKPI